MEYIFWYKVLCLFAGLVIIFLGYMLFLKGIFTESGDVEGVFKDYKLAIKKAAPGTYFVLFGSIIIGMVVFKGISQDESLTAQRAQPQIEHSIRTGKDTSSQVSHHIDFNKK